MSDPGELRKLSPTDALHGEGVEGEGDYPQVFTSESDDFKGGAFEDDGVNIEGRHPGKCSVVRADGSLCEGWKVRGEEKCQGHLGRLGGDTTRKGRVHSDEQISQGLDGFESLGETGSTVGASPHDVRDALDALRAIVRPGKGRKPDSPAVVSAARALLDSAGMLAPPKPRTVRELESLSTPALEALIRRLEAEGAGLPAA